MGTHPIFESDFDCLTEIEMAKGEKEMAAKKAAAQIPNPESVNDFPTMDAPAKKGGKKKNKKQSFFADLEEELDNPDLVKELEEKDVEPVLSKSQLKKQKRNQKKQNKAQIIDSEEEPEPEEAQSEEEMPPQKQNNKGKNKKNKKGKASFAD